MDIKRLLPWFQQKDLNQPLLGLDIGSSEIKLLQIDNQTHRIVEYFATVPVPTGLIEKDVIKKPSELADLLRAALRKHGIYTKSVALAVPRSAVIIKNTTVDARLGAKEIESRAWVEAGQQFPDLIGEINLDYTILGPSAGDPSKLDMVLVACRKEQIKPYLDFIKEAGLQAKLVDVNCYAFERALRLESIAPQETVALLNIDYSITSLVVVRNKMQLFAHDYSFDGKNLKTMLSAEIENQTQNIEKVLKDQFSTHLRHVIHFFYSSLHNVPIQRIYLSGDLATLPILQPYIQAESGIETQIAKPCQGMTVGPQVDRQLLEQLNPALVLCCGLALSDVKNLS